ncbi:MAG: branched-chain amino acid transport system permease protein [Rhodospirillaceae bacterium]|nr:branched-chain amino acid transport system permease protein [Rhodospirillaceae bacterium]
MLPVLQSIVNGIVSGAILALPTIAFTMMYSTLGFPNSAFAAFVGLGAYVGYVANVSFGIPFYLAAPVAGLILAPLGAVIGRIVFRQFHGQRSLAPMIAGVGVFMVLENVVRFVWGNGIRGLDMPLHRPWVFAGLRLNPDQATILLIAVILGAGAFAFLKYTPVGRAIRAVSDDPVLAEVRGVNSEATIRVVWLITCALAGAAGVLIAADSVLTPLLGWQVILPMFAAALLGGIGSPLGAVFGALLMGIAAELSVLAVAPTYKTAVAFAVMVVILLFRPQGLIRVRL